MATSGQPRILVIDDDPWIHRIVRARLQAEGFETIGLTSGTEAVAEAQDLQVDVILLDIDLPEVSGFDVCSRLKEDIATRLIPIIFLTGHTQTEHKVRGLDLGATDYVMKPFDSVELCARVRSAVRTKFLLDLLEKRAQIDGLTGLFNRAHFDERLQEELCRCNRYGAQVSLIMVDVDRFKQINDNHGHYFGDRVLCDVAATMRQDSRGSDLLARYGGEEFAIILPEQDVDQAARVAERTRKLIENLHYTHKSEKLNVTASFGVSCTRDLKELTPQRLINAADGALYAAKEGGRNQVCFFDGVSVSEFHPQPTKT